MENRQVTNCNQCPNQCPADSLKCGRGRHYFEQMENPDAKETGDRGHHGHGKEHSHGKPDDLYGLMRACGHYLHHSERKEHIFDGLNETEQENLKALLKKLVDSWWAAGNGEM